MSRSAKPAETARRQPRTLPGSRVDAGEPTTYVDARDQHGADLVKISLASIFVTDQAAALDFYTDVLGFVKKSDIPVGEFRWLTVVSPEGPEGIELLLEPNDNPAASTFQRAIYEQGIPATSFAVDDIKAEHERLIGLGVTFTMEPMSAEGVVVAAFDDTCGNLIQLHQPAD